MSNRPRAAVPERDSNQPFGTGRANRIPADGASHRTESPSSCESEHDPAELEVMLAIEEYKKRSGRLFPTWSEILEVIKSLGYTKDN
jgi:hypothetical protein